VVSRPRALSSRVRLYALLGLTAAVGLAAVTVVLLTAGGRSHVPAAAGGRSRALETPGGHSHAPVAPPRVALRSVTADFALLRSAAVDSLPRRYLSAVRHVPTKYELIPSGARESKDGVWLVPGHNGLCLFLTDSEGPAVVCGSLAEAESKGVSFFTRNQRSGQEHWTGAVPDGTVQVRALAADGATLAIATPESSIYRLTATNVQKISAER
jgi:hypothetical protein